jgi:hypothetical protein
MRIRWGKPLKYLAGLLTGKTTKQVVEEYVADVVDANGSYRALIVRCDELIARFELAITEKIKPLELKQELLLYRALVKETVPGDAGADLVSSIDLAIKAVDRGVYYINLGRMEMRNVKSYLERMGR